MPFLSPIQPRDLEQPERPSAIEAGNVSVIFGLLLIPILGLVGAAVDYSRAANAATSLQRAVDATALVVSKRATSLSATQLNENAAASVAGQFAEQNASLGSVTATFSAADATSLTVSAEATVKPVFAHFVGMSAMPVTARSTVTWSMTHLRIALVLDNTGSMATAGKMDALKTATRNLLTQLKTSSKNADDVFVSLIPFSRNVNVGPAARNASWLRWDLFGTGDRSSWNGCVTDRDKNFDTTATVPSAFASQYPAESYAACPTPLLALTNDWAALDAKVGAMAPSGLTNQTIGLQWGFASLTGPSPLTVPAKNPNVTYKDVIILLTDGMNTQNRYSSVQSEIDARTLSACENVKSAGITLYAFQVNTGGDPVSTMLQSCATDAKKTAVLTSADQIIGKFAEVAKELTQLRISH